MARARPSRNSPRATRTARQEGAAITDSAGSTAYVCSALATPLTSPNGQYAISVTDAGITLAHGTTSIKLVGDDITVRSDQSTTVMAGTSARLEASSNLTLKASGDGHAASLLARSHCSRQRSST